MEPGVLAPLISNQPAAAAAGIRDCVSQFIRRAACTDRNKLVAGKCTNQLVPRADGLLTSRANKRRSFGHYVARAAWCLDEDHADLSIAVSRAKAYASEAFPRIGIDVIQLHGAIGYTWEYDAHLFLKRAKWVRPIFGDAEFHYERVAALGGL